MTHNEHDANIAIATQADRRPQIGQITTIRNQQCRIVAVHKFGTLDAVSLDGKCSYRLTGLFFI
jgi:hypothetical protein